MDTRHVFISVPDPSKLLGEDAIRNGYKLLLLSIGGKITWLTLDVCSAIGLDLEIDDCEIALAHGSHIRQCSRDLNKHQNIKAKLAAGKQCVIDSTDAKRFGRHTLYLRCKRLNKKALLQGLKFFLLQEKYLTLSEGVAFFLVKPLH